MKKGDLYLVVWQDRGDEDYGKRYDIAEYRGDYVSFCWDFTQNFSYYGDGVWACKQEKLTPLTPEMEAVARTRIQWQHIADKAPHDHKVKKKYGPEPSAKGIGEYYHCYLCKYQYEINNGLTRDCKNCPLTGIAWDWDDMSAPCGSLFSNSYFVECHSASTDTKRKAAAEKMVEACEKRLDQLIAQAKTDQDKETTPKTLDDCILVDNDYSGCHPLIAEALKQGKGIRCRCRDSEDWEWKESVITSYCKKKGLPLYKHRCRLALRETPSETETKTKNHSSY